MSITNATNPPISYKIDSGTLTQANWDFSFEIFEEGDIIVIYDGVIQTLNADYTAAIDGDNGGTITFVMSVVDTFAVGKIITLSRNLQAVRATSYQSTQRFDPEVVDDDMDRLTLLAGQSSGEASTFSMRFPVDYPYLNSPGYNVIPATWPSGYALIQQNGQLAFAPIANNPGDPLLRADLAVQIAPNEGTRLVGHTGETVYSKLGNLDTEIASKVNSADLANQVNPNEGAKLVGYTGETVYARLVTNTTDIGTNATNITTNANDITDLKALPQVAMSVLTTDTAGTFVPARSYNVASIMKVSTGKYQINFTTPLIHNIYSPLATAAQEAMSWRITGQVTTSVTFEFHNGSGAVQDSKFAAVAFIFGV